MKSKKANRLVTKNDYKFHKKLLDAGLDPRQVAKITGRSPITVKMMADSANVEEYRQLMRAHYDERQARRNAQTPAEEQSQAVETGDSAQEPSNEAQETDEVAQLMAEMVTKLSAVEAALQTILYRLDQHSQQKRGLFGK